MKNLLQKTSTILVAVVLVGSFGLFGVYQQISAESRSLAELMKEAQELQKKIDAAEERANELANQARSLEGAIAELDSEIEQMTMQIDLLQKELEIAERELERQRKMLRANMRALYKRGGASTVELLVGSDSFSQFIDEQEYLERLKASVQESTEKILELKQDIEANKEKQEAARKALQSRRQARATLLEQTRGSEARYREHVRNLTEQQRAVNRELVRLSRIVSTGGSGGYPWSGARCVATDQVSGNCPNFEWYVGDDKSDRRDTWGYYYRNCTSYVAWKSAQKGLKLSGKGSMGNGGQWAANAHRYGLKTGDTPKRGAFAVWETGGFGHVAYVEDVEGNNVIVSEYNFVADGEFSIRQVTKNSPGAPTKYVYTPWSE